MPLKRKQNMAAGNHVNDDVINDVIADDNRHKSIESFCLIFHNLTSYFIYKF